MFSKNILKNSKDKYQQSLNELEITAIDQYIDKYYYYTILISKIINRSINNFEITSVLYFFPSYISDKFFIIL